jgi:hypothetical protein
MCTSRWSGTAGSLLGLVGRSVRRSLFHTLLIAWWAASRYPTIFPGVHGTLDRMRRVPLLAGVALAVALSGGPPAPALASHARAVSAAPARHTIAAYQRRLDGLGCDAGRASGRVDRHTRAALFRLQTRRGLRVTGGSTARPGGRSPVTALPGATVGPSRPGPATAGGSW